MAELAALIKCKCGALIPVVGSKDVAVCRFCGAVYQIATAAPIKSLRVGATRQLLISVKSEMLDFIATPYLEATFAIITAIRVQDVARHIWFNWDRPGPWDPSSPVITPGSGTLYIAFYAVNQGVGGNLTLSIWEFATGVVLATKTVYADPGAGVGIEYTGNMPYQNYHIRLTVIP